MTHINSPTEDTRYCFKLVQLVKKISSDESSIVLSEEHRESTSGVGYSRKYHNVGSLQDLSEKYTLRNAEIPLNQHEVFAEGVLLKLHLELGLNRDVDTLSMVTRRPMKNPLIGDPTYFSKTLLYYTILAEYEVLKSVDSVIAGMSLKEFIRGYIRVYEMKESINSIKKARNSMTYSG